MLPGLKKRVVNLHDVLMYVAIARKHIRLMCLLMCFAWLAGIVYYVYAKPVYFARALIKIDIVDRNNLPSAEQNFGERNRVQGFANEISAPHIKERTASALGVKAGVKDIEKHYLKKLSVKRNSESNFEVEVYPYSREWAQRWTETMVREFLNYRIENRHKELEQRRQMFEADLKKLDEIISEQRDRFAKGRVDQQSTDVFVRFEALRQVPYEKLDVMRKLDEIGKARVQLVTPDLDTIEKLSLISSVSERMEIGVMVPPTGSAPSSVPNPSPDTPAPGAPASENSSLVAGPSIVTPSISKESGWKNLVLQLNILKAKKEVLNRDYHDAHRSVVPVVDEIERIKVELEAELKTAMDRLDYTQRDLTRRLSEVNAKMPAYEEAMQNMKKVNDNQSILQMALQSWTEKRKRMDQELERDLFSVDRDRINPAYGGILSINDHPVSPPRLMMVVYATVFGLMLAIGIPFLIEYLDHTLSNLEDVEATFQLRGLGIIPKLETTTDKVTLLDRDSAKESNLLENFRVIRTNLLSMGALSKAPHVTMIASAMPKEGKTVVSSNLALSFAQTGARTLLIDTDLRRGRLHRLFGYRKQPGLSGVLLNQITLDEAIRTTQHENLSIISAGQHLETGTELLGSQKFADVMAELRKRFDRIVMDTPPVLGLSETSVLQGLVDGVLFVIWSNQTPIKCVKAAVEMLQANGANFYGFVLNRLDLTSTANYYQYYYYSHDYYYQYSPRALENAQ